MPFFASDAKPRYNIGVENEEGTVLDIEMQVTGEKSTVNAGEDETTVIKGLPLHWPIFCPM